jgi:hypothetical protein
MRVFHYSVARYLPQILEDKMILPSTEGLEKERWHAVWFSTNPIWEESANKMYLASGIRIPGNKLDTHEIGKGLMRIEVVPEAAPYDWEQYKRKSMIPGKLARSFLGNAKKGGANPKEWRASFKPVPQRDWLSVELFNWDTQVWEDSMVAFRRLERMQKEKEEEAQG